MYVKGKTANGRESVSGMLLSSACVLCLISVHRLLRGLSYKSDCWKPWVCEGAPSKSAPGVCVCVCVVVLNTAHLEVCAGARVPGVSVAAVFDQVRM